MPARPVPPNRSSWSPKRRKVKPCGVSSFSGGPTERRLDGERGEDWALPSHLSVLVRRHSRLGETAPARDSSDSAVHWVALERNLKRKHLTELTAFLAET